MKPSTTAGSGETSSRRSGLSKTSGETYSKTGAAGQAAWKCRPAAEVMPVFQPCGTTSAPCELAHVGDAADLGQAAAAPDIGLHDADLADRQPFAHLEAGRRGFRAADADRALLGQPRMAGEIVMLQRRLGEEDVRSRATRSSTNSASCQLCQR